MMNYSLAVAGLALAAFQTVKAGMLMRDTEYIRKHKWHTMPTKSRKQGEVTLFVFQAAAMVVVMMASETKPLHIYVAGVLGLLMVVADGIFAIWLFRTLATYAYLGRTVFFVIYMTMLVALIVEGIVLPVIRAGTT